MTKLPDQKACQVLLTMGRRRQVEQAISELNQLAVALYHHFRQGKGSITEVMEEIADVEIMLAQIYQLVDKDQLEAIRHKKIEKLDFYLWRVGEIPREISELQHQITKESSTEEIERIELKINALRCEMESIKG